MNKSTAIDNLVFAPEEEETSVVEQGVEQAPWKIIVADDEEEVHAITRLALAGFSFAGRDLRYVSAYSGADAVRAVAEHPDAALILLDVVMETEHAGLEAVKAIRETVGNRSIRIVLRTGQPGQAPEHSVVQHYDINDYKEKTELTVQKMLTLVYSSLRSYRDIRALEANNTGLEQIIESANRLFERQPLDRFTSVFIEQLTALLHLDEGAPYGDTSAFAAECDGPLVQILGGIGKYEDCVGADAAQIMPQIAFTDVGEALKERTNVVNCGRFTGHFQTQSGRQYVFHVSGARDIGELDQKLLSIFCNNISIAHENMRLSLSLDESQKELLYILADAVEARCEETGSHVKRVAEYSRFIADRTDLDEETAELIHLAAPLHDLGKISVPDAILKKPGRLTRQEWAIVRSHAAEGHRLLRASSRPVIRAAATIALEHHEKWDGTGYPNGKSGEDIHIFGRITALADVFDALANDRPYKKAWPTDQIREYLVAERGRHFDPALVDIVLENFDEFVRTGDSLEN